MIPGLASVIVPAYNVERYIRHALDSVLAQTYREWEAVIVDDGSTDRTAEVVRGFSDPRLRYVYQPNRGLAAARNTAIARAQGEYLALLDGDDVWEPAFLARCVDELARCTSPHVAGVYAAYFNIDEGGAALPQVHTGVVPEREFRARLLRDTFILCSGTVLRAGAPQIHFDEGLRALEDWDLFLRLSPRFVLRGVPDQLVRYRVRPGSLSSDPELMHHSRMCVLEKHFGPLEAGSGHEPEKTIAYGYGLRRSGFDYLHSGRLDEAWRLLAEAAAILPELLERLDTFYEFAVGDQPRGLRGEAHLLDVEANSQEMLARLGHLFENAGPEVRRKQAAAFGQASLALGMLSDKAGHARAARRYFCRAFAWDPRLIAQPRVIVRFAKVCARPQRRRLAERCTA